jgi:hypothetical protein
MANAQATTDSGSAQREAELQSLRLQLEETRDEAELNLLLLQQLQEELDSSLLAQQQQDELLLRQRQEMDRAETLIRALLERLDQQS